MKKPIPERPIFVPGIYRHYKGGRYDVVDLALHSETLQWHIMYVALDEDAEQKVWVRPYDIFMEKVEYEGNLVPRFELFDT
jgi:hypothetical protein